MLDDGSLPDRQTELLDQVKGWASHAHLQAAEMDPRRKAMLANIMHHYKWEVLDVPDNLLGGVHPDAHYRFYGLGPQAIDYRGHD